MKPLSITETTSTKKYVIIGLRNICYSLFIDLGLYVFGCTRTGASNFMYEYIHFPSLFIFMYLSIVIIIRLLYIASSYLRYNCIERCKLLCKLSYISYKVDE